jgi:Flp pilus assembly pilin Flp
MFLALYVKGQTLMSNMGSKIAAVPSRLKREDGAVATEYALLLVLIALAIIVAAAALGTAIYNVFDKGQAVLNGTGVNNPAS